MEVKENIEYSLIDWLSDCLNDGLIDWLNIFPPLFSIYFVKKLNPIKAGCSKVLYFSIKTEC